MAPATLTLIVDRLNKHRWQVRLPQIPVVAPMGPCAASQNRCSGVPPDGSLWWGFPSPNDGHQLTSTHHWETEPAEMHRDLLVV